MREGGWPVKEIGPLSRGIGAVPVRHGARHGGSREPITETLRRLCPFCNGEAVREAGQRSVVNGALKSLCRCQVCDVPSLWVRPVVESSRPLMGRPPRRPSS